VEFDREVGVRYLDREGSSGFDAAAKLIHQTTKVLRIDVLQDADRENISQCARSKRHCRGLGKDKIPTRYESLRTCESFHIQV